MGAAVAERTRNTGHAGVIHAAVERSQTLEQDAPPTPLPSLAQSSTGEGRPPPVLPGDPVRLPVGLPEQIADRASDGPTGRPFRGGLRVTGATSRRLLLFTFDDGPHREHTKRLLDILDERDVKAVFFLNGERILGENRRQRAQVEVARETIRRGHIVGNHTVHHPQLPLLNNLEVAAEIDSAADIIKRLTGERPWLLRPPGGARSPRVDELIGVRGYTIFEWNLGAGDFQVDTPQAVVDIWVRVFERRQRELGHRGGIILLHDTHAWSVDAVPMLFDKIDEWNCEALALGEELYDIVDSPRYFFFPREKEAYGSAAPPAQMEPEVHAYRQQNLRDHYHGFCEPPPGPPDLDESQAD
ncbi:MAG: polysaccharide deacetylase family protein [Myxococcota bacterium]